MLNLLIKRNANNINHLTLKGDSFEEIPVMRLGQAPGEGRN